MSQRTEATLAIVIGFALLGAGILTWGQETGQLTIFGDAPVVDVTSPLPITVSESVAPNEAQIVEDFSSSRFLDATQTTADWNLDASEVRLATGLSEGTVQSTTVAMVTGGIVRVTLATKEELPYGSQIYYAISADGGASWTPVLPGTAATIANASGDWRWQALLKRGIASLGPAIQELHWTLQSIEN